MPQPSDDVEIVWPFSVLPEEMLRGATKTVYFAVPEVVCRRCMGSGWEGQQHCPICHGTRWESIPRVAVVQLPAFVTEGQRLRVAGAGRRAPDGEVGDVYLECAIAWHEQLRIEGDDLLIEAPISSEMASEGGQVTVCTPYGPQTVEVPPGSADGQEVIWGDWGLVRLDGTRGSLRVTLRRGEEPPPHEPDPDWVDAQISTASRAVREQRWDEALQTISACSKLVRNDPRVLFVEGKCLYRTGRRYEAVDVLERAATLAASQPRPWHDLARYALQIGDHLQAAWACETAMRAGLHTGLPEIATLRQVAISDFLLGNATLRGASLGDLSTAAEAARQRLYGTAAEALRTALHQVSDAWVSVPSAGGHGDTASSGTRALLLHRLAGMLLLADPPDLAAASAAISEAERLRQLSTEVQRSAALIRRRLAECDDARTQAELAAYCVDSYDYSGAASLLTGLRNADATGAQTPVAVSLVVQRLRSLLMAARRRRHQADVLSAQLLAPGQAATSALDTARGLLEARREVGQWSPTDLAALAGTIVDRLLPALDSATHSVSLDGEVAARHQSWADALHHNRSALVQAARTISAAASSVRHGAAVSDEDLRLAELLGCLDECAQRINGLKTLCSDETAELWRCEGLALLSLVELQETLDGTTAAERFGALTMAVTLLHAATRYGHLPPLSLSPSTRPWQRSTMRQTNSLAPATPRGSSSSVARQRPSRHR